MSELAHNLADDVVENTDEIAEEATYEDLAIAMERFALSYQLLSRLYRKEPEQAFIDELRVMRFPAQTGNNNLDKGYYKLATYLSRVGSAAEGELAVDYTRTFLGYGTDSFSAAYPFESVHTGRKRLMMQGARDEVLAIYRAYGLDKSGNMKDSEDHIAYELEFMQFLCERCAQALQANNISEAETLAATQANFLDDHLLNWIEKFTVQMRHFSKTEFYRGLSYITVGVLEDHRALLDEVLD